MQCIIFSFNRACQLNTLLESARNYIKNIDVQLNVVYNSSDDFYEQGYTLLRKNYPDVQFIKETISNTSKFLSDGEYGYWRNYYNFFKYPARVKGSSFKQNVSDILHSGNEDLVFFLTDDSVFTSEPFIDPEVSQILKKSPADSMFSFRHGLNLADTPKESLYHAGNYIHYEVMQKDSPHWTYKFSVDGHVYSREFIKKMSDKILYSNPNSFEAFLNTYAVKNNYFKNIYFNTSTTLVGFELNRVQSFSDNNNLNFSTEKLNSYFINGYTLNYIHDVINDFRPVLTSLQFSKLSDNFTIKL